MKILFLGYRDWARRTFIRLAEELGDLHQFHLIQTPQQFRVACTEPYDLGLLVGWSWIIPAQIIRSTPTIGIHPSDLPNYAGGSPIQHQIIEGVTKSKITLFRLSEKLDAGPIIAKKDFDLTGTLPEILDRLSTGSFELIRDLLFQWPEVPSSPQHTPGAVVPRIRKRLSPEDGKLTAERIGQMNCRQLYDFIRGREDPYPYVYMEDETGKILFQRVGFEEPA